MGSSRNVNLDEAADRLYGLSPTEFTAARDALAREAKAAGDVRLSREIAKLRRPTIAAWAINQATRRHPDELGKLLDIGERLRAAWQEQEAEALAELSRQRSTAISRLAGLIRHSAEASGRRLAALPEVEQTLDAAVIDAEAAEQVRQGRLVTPLSYSGFVPAPVSSAPALRRTARRKQAPAQEAPSQEAPSQEGRAQQAAGPPARDDLDEARRAAERQRQELEQAAAEAERAASEAERAHAEWAAELEKAVREHDRRAKKVAELTEKLAAARAKLTTAEKALKVTQRDEAAARASAESGRRKADQARRAIPP
jgi:hypothetical protein